MSLGQGNLLNNRYRIVDILGRGGMGAVYRAVDESLGVDVAVKENLFTTDDYARQFRMEAVILAGIRHPNLPRVTDHFVLDELGQYLVMDYIEGDDLRQRIERQGTIPESEAIRIGAAVCDALSYLHSRKPPILHRDIKLGNIKLTPDGGVLLVDFGLAKMAWEHEQTMTGARAMTPGYSPPEQYGSARTDARSDIYSLGATLYAAITGVVPEDSLMRAVDGLDLTPMRKHKPEISKRLATVIEKAMEPIPNNRFQSAEEFKRALLGYDEVTETDTDVVVAPAKPDAEPATPAKQRRKAGAFFRFVGILILLAAVALGIIFVDPANQRLIMPYLGMLFSPTPVPTIVETATPFLEISATPILVLDTIKTPSPTKAIPEPTSTATQLPTATATTEAIVQPTDPVATATNAVVVPPTLVGGGVGEIAFASIQNSLSQIFLINGDGTNLRQLTNDINGACNFDWSPDGKKLVFVSPCSSKATQYIESGLYVLDLETNISTPLLDAPKGEFDPAWSPDGTKIVFTSFRDQTWQIYFADVTSALPVSTITQLTFTNPDGNTQSRYPTWSPDNSQILFSLRKYGQFQLWAMNLDGSDQKRFLNDGNAFSDLFPTWSPDGTFVLFNQTNLDLSSPSYLMRLNPGMDRAERLDAVQIPVVDVSFSPDGIWIAYETSDTRNQDIYLFNLLEGKRQRLTTDAAIDFDPAWKPK